MIFIVSHSFFDINVSNPEDFHFEYTMVMKRFHSKRKPGISFFLSDSVVPHINDIRYWYIEYLMQSKNIGFIM